MPYPVPNVHPIDQELLIAIGADLRRRRREAWLTQRQLESLTNVDQTTISRVENGRISTFRLHRYARLLAGVEGRFGTVERRPRRRRRASVVESW
jgi:transcriptional regulator with XRE-family HTH domain